MKTIIIALLLFAGTLYRGYTQPIQSSCQAPWVLQQAYEQDVKNLAVKYLRNIHHPDTLYVTIPQIHQQMILEGLAAIFNSSDAGRDSIFDMYCVHDLAYQPVVSGFIIGVDANAPWLNAWQNLQTLTGVPLLDSLLVKYDLHITNWFSFINAGVFSSSKLLNPYALEDSLIWASPYIDYLDPDMMIGAAGLINFQKSGDIRNYTFYFQWNDCFDGCDNWHYWEYNVYPDCSVEFMGTGDWGFFGVEPLPAPINCNITTGINPPDPKYADIVIYPNPSSSEVNIALPGDSGDNMILEIYSSGGNLIAKTQVRGKNYFHYNIAELDADTYIIRIQSGRRIYTGRFVK